MADLGTGMTALGIALGGKDMLIKLLGPTADYLGGGLKDFTVRRAEAVKSIFSNASSKVGDDLDKEGGVSPKVLKGILDDGSFADDFLTIDYFGGILASSRTGIARDDRGAYFNSLISRLSTYQLRGHYILYHLFKQVFHGETHNMSSQDGRVTVALFIPLQMFAEAMAFTNEELESLQIVNFLDHILYGLAKENLIDDRISYGEAHSLQSVYPEVKDRGLVVAPTISGIELFLNAYGKGKILAYTFFRSDEEFKLDDNVRIGEGAMRIYPK